MNDNSKYGVIILAAGNSSRMKTVKSFLKYDSNRCFIEKIIDTYLSFHCNKIILVKNSHQSQWSEIENIYRNTNLQIINNSKQELGRFYSLKLATKSLQQLDHCFIQNSDNPFVNYQLLQLLSDNRDKGDFQVPIFNNKGGHPILINNQIISDINYSTHFPTLNNFLKDYTRTNIQCKNNQILTNVNTPSDYRELIAKQEIYA